MRLAASHCASPPPPLRLPFHLAGAPLPATPLPLLPACALIVCRGLEGSQNWLFAPVWYRVCGKIDYAKIVKKYDMECFGVKGDGKCSVPSAAVGEGFSA